VGSASLTVRSAGGVRGGGAGVGGGVHDGGEDFVLVGGGADFEVVEAAAFVVEEDALAVAEVFFGRFGAVLVEGVDAAVGDAGEEVVVVFDRGLGEGVFHVGDRVGVGDVADFVQGGGDDGCGAGGDDSGGEGGGGFFAGRRHWAAGESGAGECGVSEGEAAAGFGGADPEPGAEELGGVPGPVIGRGPGHRTRRDQRDCSGGSRSRGFGGGVDGGSCGAVGGGGCGGSGRGGGGGGGLSVRSCGGLGFIAPTGGPAARAAGLPGGVDRLGPCPVHRRGGEELKVFDAAGEFLGELSEIGCLKEVGCGELFRRRTGGGVQQRQGRLQIRRCQGSGRQLCRWPGGRYRTWLSEGRSVRTGAGGSTAVGRPSVRTGAGGSNAVGRVLYRRVRTYRRIRTGISRGDTAKPAAAQQTSSTQAGDIRPGRGIRSLLPNGFHGKTISTGSDIFRGDEGHCGRKGKSF
jgi:hypothetical protein